MANIRLSSKIKNKIDSESSEDPTKKDEPKETQEKELFTKRMRRETRDVHKISDALINAKLAFASSDINVWTDGLLVFYEVFRFLEENMPDELLPRDFHRARAFEEDLAHYLGDDWKDNYTIRPSVQMYIDHLTDVNKQHPILLLAYVYHLYMGLLSGGQILQKKRSLFRSVGQAGQAVTHFPGHTIGELKTQMRDMINTLADDFDESTKTLLIAESRMVFHLNNELVRSVNGVNWASLRKFAIIMAVVVGVFYILRFD